MRNRGRFAAKAAGVFAAMALMVGLMGPAGAAEIDVSFLLEDGSEITTPGQVLPLFDPDNPMSSGIVGVWDDTTGDLTADLEIAPRQSQECVASGGTFGILTSTTTYDASEVVGNIDPVTGDAELSTDVDVSIDIPNIDLYADAGCTVPLAPLALDTTCEVGPVNIQASSSNPGGQPFDLDLDNGTFVVTEQDISIGAAVCTAPNPDLATLVQTGLNTRFELPTDAADATMNFVVGEIVPPDPPPPPSTLAPTTVAPAAPPPAATAIQATPRVTG
jgi:hypothetical protein